MGDKPTLAERVQALEDAAANAAPAADAAPLDDSVLDAIDTRLVAVENAVGINSNAPTLKALRLASGTVAATPTPDEQKVADDAAELAPATA